MEKQKTENMQSTKHETPHANGNGISVANTLPHASTQNIIIPIGETQPSQATDITKERPSPLPSKSSFLSNLYDYWHELKGQGTLPCKKSFSPGKFPRYIPKLCILNRSLEAADYKVSLAGDGVYKRLKLIPPMPLSAMPEEKAYNFLCTALKRVQLLNRPIFDVYYNDEALYPFSCLVMPFTDNPNFNHISSIILAFDFERYDSVSYKYESLE